MKDLLKFAREVIKAELNGDKVNISDNIKKKYSKKQACFVTLTLSHELRGCIGSLEARQELWKDVLDNSINAAFRDSRFEPVSLDEIGKIKIEISVLSESKKLEHKNPEELLNRIDNKMGIVLRKGFYSATFLPQVWEELPDKLEFLAHLSRKAGLSQDAWKESEIYFYRVKSVKE